MCADEERVVAFMQADGLAVNGVRYNQTYCHVFGFRDGKIGEFWEFFDSVLAESAIKLFDGKKLDPIEGLWHSDGLGTLVIFKDQTSQIELVIYWSIIGMITQIPLSIYLYGLVKRKFKLNLDKFTITKYIIISIGTFGVSFVLSEMFLIYNNSIFEFIPSLFVFILLGVVGYLVLTYVVDTRTQKLFKAIINEVKK